MAETPVERYGQCDENVDVAAPPPSSAKVHPENMDVEKPVDPTAATDEVIIPNRWELFIVARPCCSCCTFFWISMILTFITTRMLSGGALKFEVGSVWDVRGDIIVTQRDSFLQALRDSGQQLMCQEGGGPPKPCEADEIPRNYSERSRPMAVMTIIYEAEEDEDVLTSKNFEFMKEFETKLTALGIYKTACQLVDEMHVHNENGKMVPSKSNGARQCAGIQSLVNDLYVDSAVHEDLMTNQCFTAQPVCKAGAATPFCAAAGADLPCLRCGTGAGALAFGTPPCRASSQATWSTTQRTSEILCSNMDKATSESVKTMAYYGEMRNQMLPSKFVCVGGLPGKVRYSRSFVSFGAPLEGHTQFAGADKEKQQDDFNSWFVKDMWPEVEKLRKDVEKNSDGKLRIYAMSLSAITALFNNIFMSDGLLAMGSLLFVTFWIWTATGSLFLALCGVYECFISLFLAMLTFSAISKYIGFLCVMMIFVIVGIGADDIFVFLDAFKQSAYQPQLQGDINLRFAWAWRRSANAMFVTTATTAVSFLSAGFSEIPTVSAFGFFAAFTVIWDYIMVITFFAAAVVVYHQNFEGKRGGHMCMDYKCCCCRLLTPSMDKRSQWRAYKPLMITCAVLVFFGSLICTIGSVGKMPFIPMIGTILICIAAICAQAVVNMPEDPGKMRILETFFSTTFHSWLTRHSKKAVAVWSVILLVCTIVVAALFRPATEAPKFLSEDNPIMKFIDVSAEFSSNANGLVLHTVFGIQKEDGFDRSGIDAQTPDGEYLGKVRYSAADGVTAGTPVGQQVMLDYCDALRASDMVLKDPACNTAFHAGSNPTFKLPTLGTEVGHCKTGVYCFIYNVQDFLTAHCKPCIGVMTSGCNPAANFKPCLDSAGAALSIVFPTVDLHKVLQSENFTAYMKFISEGRYLAGHGHENSKYDSMTGFKHNEGGWVGWIGGNFSMPKRSVYSVKKEWYDKTKAFVEANTAGMPQAFGTCSRFNWMVTENALYKNTIQAFIMAVLFAWAMLVLTGWNWWTGTLGFMSVVCICVVSTAIMVFMGWELGIIESIAIITVVGVSVDYSVHLIHAFGESTAETPAERVRAALMTMGISLMGGVATTVGAALFLWFAEIQFFAKFGQFLAITVLVSVFVAFTFLMPVAMLAGPTPEQGKLCKLPWPNSKTAE